MEYVSETHTERNRFSVPDAINPLHVVPTHAVWCSFELVGSRHEIDTPIDEFWTAALSVLSPSKYDNPIFHAARSPDGGTIYFVPICTPVVWRGTA